MGNDTLCIFNLLYSLTDMLQTVPTLLVSHILILENLQHIYGI